MINAGWRYDNKRIVITFNRPDKIEQPMLRTEFVAWENLPISQLAYDAAELISEIDSFDIF
jgi:hypothetical protein